MISAHTSLPVRIRLQDHCDEVTVIRLERSSERPPPRGTWLAILIDGVRSARVTCLDCGKSYALDHEIAADGTVTPSVACPTDGCKWHVHIVLDGWSDD